MLSVVAPLFMGQAFKNSKKDFAARKKDILIQKESKYILNMVDFLYLKLTKIYLIALMLQLNMTTPITP